MRRVAETFCANGIDGSAAIWLVRIIRCCGEQNSVDLPNILARIVTGAADPRPISTPQPRWATVAEIATTDGIGMSAIPTAHPTARLWACRLWTGVPRECPVSSPVARAGCQGLLDRHDGVARFRASPISVRPD